MLSSGATRTLLCLPSIALSMSLDFSNMIAGNLSPSWNCPQLYPFINSSWCWDWAEKMARCPPWQTQEQKQALHTQRDMLSHHRKNAVCLLPGPQCTWTMQTNTRGGAIIFKCNLIAERPECAVVPLQLSDNPLLSQTDRSCYFTSTHWGKPLENSYLSMGCNRRAISRPHTILKGLFVHTDTEITMEHLFWSICWSVGVLDNSNWAGIAARALYI